MTERRTVLLCALLVALGPLSLTLYSPAMPALAASLGTDLAAIQFTVTVYLMGFAGAQLVCGPLSDALGRKPVLLGFAVIYLAGTLLCLFADDVRDLLVGRVVQGIGASGGVAISRAIVRDLYVGAAGARIMSITGMIISLAPAAGQAIGGAILTFVTWRWVFLAMAGFGVALGIMVIFLMPETNRHRDRAALAPGLILGRFRRIAVEPIFLHHTLLVAPAMGGLYSFSALMPFVLIDRIGLTPLAFGFAMSLSALTYAATAGLVTRLLRTISADRIELAGGIALFVSGLLFAAQVLFGRVAAWTVIVSACAWAASAALIGPGAQMGAIGPFPAMAGAASALMGFLMMGHGIGGTLLVAASGDAMRALGILPLLLATMGLAAHLGFRPAARRSLARHIARQG
ncbi:MAG: multidrug effflux MFS transporter [Alphaproteobacteria bacterium]|nr:multidrug effflux MFS transporter [Alphaproteobacteria bacterium]